MVTSLGNRGLEGDRGRNGRPGPKGGPAEPWVHPARCDSKLHNHIDPDINYACQRNLRSMAGLIRQMYPDVYIMLYRPAMDMGVWALHYADACFTINEWAWRPLKEAPGMGPQPKNVLIGDRIRHWSRIRVHHHFFPHYLDSPLVFDASKFQSGRDWTSEHIDYIMLSALSCSPNQTYYLPSQTGIPAADKREIKKWLDWGRKNIAYLMVRKDLPDWPAAGKVDGSAHICDDRGFMFLFNPNRDPLQAEFALTQRAIGLKEKGTFKVTQDYPESGRGAKVHYGETVRWEVPGQTVVVLAVGPVTAAEE